MIKRGKCNFCQSDKYKVLFKSNIDNREKKINITEPDLKKHGQIVRCSNCDLIYDNSVLSEEYIGSLYKSSMDEEYLSERKGRDIFFNECLEFIENTKKKGKLLEVGCYTGLFLNNAKKRGWDVMGIEPSKWATEYAKQKFGLNIINDRAENIHLSDETFDVIVLIDVIEHTFDPLNLLNKINRALKKSGLVYIVTPNSNSLVARLLGEKWWSIYWVHRYYFSKNTIQKYLEKTGFKIKKIKSKDRIFSFAYIIRLLNKSFDNWLVCKIYDYLKDKNKLKMIMLRFKLFDQMQILARKENY